MTTYIQNYGFTKTVINNNKKKINNEIQWNGNYDGKVANLDLNINDNGLKEDVSLQLTNDDLIHLFGSKPVEIPLDERLYNDFLLNDNSPMALEGALIPTQRQHKKTNTVTYRRRKHPYTKSKKNRRSKRWQTYRYKR